MSERIAIFPGSFDPITKGHEDVVRRAAPLFTRLIVAVGDNMNKNYMFSQEQRLEWIRQTFQAFSNVEVMTYGGLTIDFCREQGAEYLIRGLRNPADFEFEKAVAQANRQMEPSLETVFFLTSSTLSYISSSIVRDVIRNKGDYRHFVPDSVRI
jgi:pantetheine-phosphate adenylyltransferase